MHLDVKKRLCKSYSVIVITPCYIFALSHNASTLWRKDIAFYSYHSKLIEIVIASQSYCSGLIENLIAFYSYCSENMTKVITGNAVTFWSNVADLCVTVKTPSLEWGLSYMAANRHPCWSLAQSQLPHLAPPPLYCALPNCPLSRQHNIYLPIHDIKTLGSSSIWRSMYVGAKGWVSLATINMVGPAPLGMLWYILSHGVGYSFHMQQFCCSMGM